MKILNWVISVLVLVAAIGAAVVSFLLFQKREQMLTGWDQMASAIRNTAASLDAGSGTKVADSLKKGKLDHKLTADELKKNLAKLNDAAKKVVEQRDGLADQLVQVARTMEVNTGKADALKNLDTTKANQAAILMGIQQVRRQNEGVLGSFVSFGQRLGVRDGTVSKLKNPGFLTGYSERLKSAVDGKNQRINTYQSELNNISRQVSVTFDASDRAYRVTAQAVTAGVRKQANNLRQETAVRKRVESELAAAKRSIAQAERSNAESKAEIAKLNGEVKKLLFKLNPTNNSILNDYINDNIREEDLYALVRGKVCKFDNKWGIVVVDVGRHYDVRRVVAGRELSNVITIPDPPEEGSLFMTVVRGDTGDKPEYIGRIRVTGVFDNYCVANADGKDLKSAIREGDTVLFNQEDIREVMKAVQQTSRKKTSKKR